MPVGRGSCPCLASTHLLPLIHSDWGLIGSSITPNPCQGLHLGAAYYHNNDVIAVPHAAQAAAARLGLLPHIELMCVPQADGLCMLCAGFVQAAVPC
jgi:hypothetical protein